MGNVLVFLRAYLWVFFFFYCIKILKFLLHCFIVLFWIFYQGPQDTFHSNLSVKNSSSSSQQLFIFTLWALKLIAAQVSLGMLAVSTLGVPPFPFWSLQHSFSGFHSTLWQQLCTPILQVSKLLWAEGFNYCFLNSFWSYYLSLHMSDALIMAEFCISASFKNSTMLNPTGN